MDSPILAVDSGQQSTEWVDLQNDFFELKVPREKLFEKFDARVLIDAEKRQLGPILDQWERIAEKKAGLYSRYKLKKQPENHLYVNPFLNSSQIINQLKFELTDRHNYYIGAYDKTTSELQALATVTFRSKTNGFVIGYLATHPNNIRSKGVNPERVSGAASRVILEIEEWARDEKVNYIKLRAVIGSRSFYQHIGFQPLQPPYRHFWIYAITLQAKIDWIEKNQEYLKNLVLNEDDKTEESSEEDVVDKVIVEFNELNI